MSLVLVRDLILPVFEKPCFICSDVLLLVYRLLKLVDVRLMVSMVDGLARRQVRDVGGMLIMLIV